ncbi:MAG: hypothetical protein AAGJ37_06535 [Pseudomonadota bacterium]
MFRTVAKKSYNLAKKHILKIKLRFGYLRYFDSKWYLRQYPDVSRLNDSPIDHYVTFGWKEGRNPSPKFNTNRYLYNNPDVTRSGINPLDHWIIFGKKEGRPAMANGYQFISDDLLSQPVGVDFDNAIHAYQVMLMRFPYTQPLNIFSSRCNDKRVNLVTDSVSPESLYGGVGTSLIFACLLAKRFDFKFRLITLNDRPILTGLNAVLNTLGADWTKNIEIVDTFTGQSIDDCAGDIYVTSSWWSTARVSKSIPSKRIVYLVQDDEKMFYPMGDDWSKANTVLGDPNIKKVINSFGLSEHLRNEYPSTPPHHHMYFEPSFPITHFYRNKTNTKEKIRLVFYARPSNPRNLFFLGLEVLASSIEAGILNEKDFEFYFVGKDIPDFFLPLSIAPRLIQNIPWNEYAALMRTVDIGFSLMCTPHPGYFPLDVVSCGGIALTNTFKSKANLHHYSKNIVSAEPTVTGMTKGLKTALELAKNRDVRLENYKKQNIKTDWNESFHHIFDSLEEDGFVSF